MSQNNNRFAALSPDNQSQKKKANKKKNKKSSELEPFEDEDQVLLDKDGGVFAAGAAGATDEPRLIDPSVADKHMEVMVGQDRFQTTQNA